MKNAYFLTKMSEFLYVSNKGNIIFQIQKLQTCYIHNRKSYINTCNDFIIIHQIKKLQIYYIHNRKSKSKQKNDARQRDLDNKQMRVNATRPLMRLRDLV